MKVLRFQYHNNARWVRTNFLQQFYHMKTDFYKIYKAGCSEKYSNYENFLHHCCDQVKGSVTDVFTNYFIGSFKWLPFETNRCIWVEFFVNPFKNEYYKLSVKSKKLPVSDVHILSSTSWTYHNWQFEDYREYQAMRTCFQITQIQRAKQDQLESHKEHDLWIHWSLCWAMGKTGTR